MNTTTNTGEALDLNKLEALAKAAEQMFTGMHWYTRFQILDGISNDESAAFIGALDPDTVLELIALARAGSAAPAAPTALDADEMTRLRRLIHALGMDGSTNASDDQVRGLLFTTLGQAAGRIERAAMSAAPAVDTTDTAKGDA